MSQLFEISAHGSRSVSSVEDIISKRINIPPNYTFVSFAPTGYPLYDSFQSYYAYSLHYYPDNLTNESYLAIEPDKRPIREPNIIKTKLLELTSATPESDREDLINMIIKYGIISMYNYKFKIADLTTIRSINYLTGYLIYDLNYYVCDKLAKPESNYTDLIEKFLNMSLINVVKKFLSYSKTGMINRDHLIGNIVSKYKKLYLENLNETIDVFQHKKSTNRQEYNRIEQLTKTKPKPKTKTKLTPEDVQNLTTQLTTQLETIGSELKKIDAKLAKLNNIVRLDKYGFYDHMAGNISKTILKKTLNQYILDNRNIIDKTRITSESIDSIRYIDFIRKMDTLNLKINIYDQAHTMPNFNFSFFSDYPGSEVSFFIGGIIETSAQSNPETFMTFKKNNDFRKNKDLLRHSLSFNKLNYLNVGEFFDRSNVDPIIESKKKIGNISSSFLIEQLAQQADFNGKCTFVIMACNVVYLNHVRAAGDTIQLVRTASSTSFSSSSSDGIISSGSSGLASSADISQPKKSGSVENISYNHIPYVPKVSDLIKGY